MSAHIPPNGAPGDRQQLIRVLTSGVEKMGLNISTGRQEKLIDYVRLLAKWNTVYNLSAVRDPTEMIIRHILDSLSVVPYIKGRRILDVGTGAGLPGLPLAMIMPSWEVVLLDSNNKKTRFITQAIAELAIANATVVNCRIEDYYPQTMYDTVISRAFTSLAEMAATCCRLSKTGGYLLAMKGKLSADELASVPDNCQIKAADALQVPGLEAEQRHLVLMICGNN